MYNGQLENREWRPVIIEQMRECESRVLDNVNVQKRMRHFRFQLNELQFQVYRLLSSRSRKHSRDLRLLPSFLQNQVAKYFSWFMWIARERKRA